MKVNLFFAASLLVGLTACGANGNSEKGDSTAVKDAESEIAPSPSTTGRQEVITDAICMDAKGEIKKIEETVKQGLYEATTVYTFNDQGQLVSSELQDSDAGNAGLSVVRDEQGGPTKLILKVYDEMDELQDYTISFSYDDAHRLTKERHENYDASWTTTYTRDADGHITAETVKDPFGGVQKSTITYPEGSFDSHGNWTKRVYKSEGEQSTVTRKITYK